MFTEGQKARMHAALNNGASDRNNLHTQGNLIATGTNDGFVPTACAPQADFNKAVKYICVGSSITFNDLSWKADPTSWSWDCPGGTPSNSTDQNPLITYNTPGVYDVTLTVSNAGGTSSITQSQMVYVSPANGAQTVPFLEDFESVGPIPSGADWIVANETGNAFELSTVAAYSGVNSMRLLNHSGNPNGTVDAFITPGYDFTNIVNGSMTFKMAFAARSNSSTDNLKVFASNNCGSTWAVRFTKSGIALSTAGIVSATFTPNGTSQWRQETVNLNSVSYNNKPSVRFKFEYTQNTGNNLYIDDINITGTSTVGIQDVEFLATVSVYPNPSAGVTNISFSTSTVADMMIEITDVTGRVVEVVENKKLNTGMHNYSFGNNLTDGLYFVRFKSNENDLTRKVVINRN
jgi:PKD repeat protein